MDDFTAGRKPVRFQSWRGTLLGANKHSTTQVHSSGGQNGQAVNISSSNTLHLQFFVRPHGGGPDVPVQVSNADVPVMDGQDVTVVAGFPGDKEKGDWLRVVNHNAQRVWPLADTLATIRPWGLVAPWGWYGLAAWILGCLLPINNLGVLGFVVMIGLLIYREIELRTLAKALNAQLDESTRAIKSLTPLTAAAASHNPAVPGGHMNLAG